MGINALCEKLAVYLTEDNLSAIQSAHKYSESAHSGQTRASGKPYIVHPLTVADILADWRADAPSIIAALLHDVVEDTPITQQQIEDGFGGEIAALVGGLSKIQRLEDMDRDLRDAENFRKLLLAAAKDWRVVFIKLADRLHNMRTLSALASPAKRRLIAEETMNIYAPIAQRLGIYKVQEELQNLCLRYLHPHRFRVLTKALKKSGEHSRAAIESVEQKLHDGMTRHGMIFSMKKRQKNLHSIYRKMERNHLSFSEVEDILGFRLIVKDRAACYQTLGILHELFTPLPHRFRDFIAVPKSNGYQSLHTGLVSEGGVKIDVQIRTAAMHELAEHGLAAHWHYKQGDERPMDEVQTRAMQQLSSLVRLHEENPAPIEFMENIKIDLFPKEMLVITPKGKIVTLPSGATALDMAYAIHTEIGDHAERALINGKPLPLSIALNSGDQVEIITNAAAAPRPHWLTVAKTARARSRIRHVLQNAEDHESAAIGKKLLIAELQRLVPDVKLEEIEESNWHTVLGGNQFKDKTALFQALGLGKLMPEVVARALLKRRVRAAGSHASKMQPILIAGAGRSAIHLSPCCHPLPHEPIVGVLRKERGLIVHSGDCPMIRGSNRRSERWTEVQWSGDAPTHAHRSILVLHCNNYPGLVSAVSGVISGQGINIVTCHFDGGAAERPSMMLELTVEVHTLAELKQLIDNLKKMKEVLTAERKREASSAAA